MTQRPCSFAWVAGLRGPEPQIIYEDPRTGCAALPILAERPIETDQPLSLDLLVSIYPAPEVSS